MNKKNIFIIVILVILIIGVVILNMTLNKNGKDKTKPVTKLGGEVVAFMEDSV